MYLAHFGLKRKPFEISPDPDFLWLGEKHREGLAILKYGIMENKGFLLITGDVGTGKTALVRALEKEIGTHHIVVSIPDPGMELLDFYNFMASELKMDRSFTNKAEFLIHFKRFLLEKYYAHKRVLLIIDEAQRLKQDLLEEIRLLSNIHLSGKLLINIFFVGQSEFKDFLAQDENRSLRQRISVSHHISPLNEDETRAYIEHRLQVAGATREIFPPEAIRAVHHHTRGYPRLINIICDYAMMSGYSTGVATLTPDIIAECAQELLIAIGTDPTDSTAPAPPETIPPAAAPAPPPEAAAQPRSARSALILVVFIAVVVAVWYVWGDAISGKLARVGKDIGLVPGSVQLKREVAPSLQSGTKSREAENASPPAGAPPLPTEAPKLQFALTFAPDSAEISPDAQNVLSLVFSLLTDFPNTMALIERPTGPSGGHSSKETLAESRAAAVKMHLMSKGIAPARLSIVAMEPEKPMDGNAGTQERSKNQRVLIRVVAKNRG